MTEELHIGFIGNPNCGKTTLFNAYTGARLKVANWPGVTVEKKEGSMKCQNREFKLVDLPGIYSLTSYTMEEKLSRKYIMEDDVDIVIDIADASCLERNLFLTLQLIELGKPVILVLNMMDIVEERGMKINIHKLEDMLKIPVVPVSARKKVGLDSLISTVISNKNKHIKNKKYTVTYSDKIEDKIDIISRELVKKYGELENKRWYAIKLLEQDF